LKENLKNLEIEEHLYKKVYYFLLHLLLLL
jgi:hypothetical protein